MAQHTIANPHLLLTAVSRNILRLLVGSRYSIQIVETRSTTFLHRALLTIAASETFWVTTSLNHVEAILVNHLSETPSSSEANSHQWDVLALQRISKSMASIHPSLNAWGNLFVGVNPYLGRDTTKEHRRNQDC